MLEIRFSKDIPNAIWKDESQEAAVKQPPRRKMQEKRTYKEVRPRFTCCGMHPDLGCSRGKDSPPPGKYNVPAPKTQTFCRDWTKELNSERWSRNMGYLRNNPIWPQRTLMREGRGPGWHDMTTEHKCGLETKFATAPRFPRRRRTAVLVTPGPGTYRTEAPPVRRGSLKGLMESGGPSGRSSGSSKPWALPPGAHYKDEPLGKPAVTKRGPYDCFTGQRDESTIKNHFAPPAFRTNPHSLYMPPSGVELLSERPKLGLWSSSVRFPKKPCIRMLLMTYCDPTTPGPGAYPEDEPPPQPPKRRKTHKCEYYPPVPTGMSFGMSNVVLQRPLVGIVKPGPGPGRYPNLPSTMREINYYSDFLSKSKRVPFPPKERMDIYI